MTTDTDIVLAGRGLSKAYGNRFTARTVQALDDASFELRKGEICGLVRPNGAGQVNTYQTHHGHRAEGPWRDRHEWFGPADGTRLRSRASDLL